MAVEKNKNRFYVYEWYNVDTKEVFYVGKGNGSRYKTVEGRNEYFTRYYNKYNCDVRKVKSNILEEEAYDLEIELIKKYRELGQCVCNFQDGGHGGASWANMKEDTQTLTTVANYINNSKKIIGGDYKNVYLQLKPKHERSVVFGLLDFGINTSEQYYDLDRNKRIEVAEHILDLLDEENYNEEVYELVNDGGCNSFDDYWDNIYKY